MTQLALLRSQLNALRRRRALVRWGHAFSTIGIALLVVVLSLFVIDWYFEPTTSWRIVMWVGGLLAMGGAFWSFTRPWLGREENLVDVALMVERQHHIDSDLVGALQFESPEATRWGSPQLQQAVVRRVADTSPNINVFTGFSYEHLGRRLMIFTALIGALVILAILVPQNLNIFGRRMLMLGQEHYPTKTQIRVVRINGQQVHPGESSTFYSPVGYPLVFEVEGSGELPAEGKVLVKSLHRDVISEVVLEKDGSEDGNAVYSGRLPKLVDSVAYQVYLGDAWTDPRIVELIPLPVVAVSITQTPPKYARADMLAEEETLEGAWQMKVVQGTRVDMSLRCTNKVLRKATLILEDKEYPFTPPQDSSKKAPSWGENLISQVTNSFLEPEERSQEWTLDVAGTPLESVTSKLQYEIRVEDTDGLPLAKPIQGFVGIKTDDPPRVAGGLLFPRYLATATPQIYYGVADDYGVANLKLRVEVIRTKSENNSAPERRDPPPSGLTEDVPLQFDGGKPPQNIRGSFALKLTSLQLGMGDQVKITLKATDYRGGEPGIVKKSEPLFITITDLIGLDEDLNKINRLSVQQMEAIIKHQLGIGDSP